MSEQIYKKQVELAKLIERHTGRDGVHATAIPSLFFIRQSNMTGPNYGVHNPSLCIVVQGERRYCWHGSALDTVLPTTLLHPLTCRLSVKSWKHLPTFRIWL